MRRDDSTVKPEMQKHNIEFEFGQTGISAIQSADPENPILEPNTK